MPLHSEMTSKLVYVTVVSCHVAVKLTVFKNFIIGMKIWLRGSFIPQNSKTTSEMVYLTVFSCHAAVKLTVLKCFIESNENMVRGVSDAAKFRNDIKNGLYDGLTVVMPLSN